MPVAAYKACSRCGTRKALIAFSPDRRRQDGRQSHCRECKAAHERAKASVRVYGVTPGEYEELVARPCAICGTTERICLDHDHTTGMVRGALCRNCNAGIGLLGDDIQRVRAAAQYLHFHQALNPCF